MKRFANNNRRGGDGREKKSTSPSNLNCFQRRSFVWAVVSSYNTRNGRRRGRRKKELEKLADMIMVYVDELDDLWPSKGAMSFQ